MSAAIVVGIGSTVIGGLMSSRTSSKASSKALQGQRYAADRAANVKLEMYHQSREDTAGQRQLFDYAAPRLKKLARQGSGLDQYVNEMNALEGGGQVRQPSGLKNSSANQNPWNAFGMGTRPGRMTRMPEAMAGGGLTNLIGGAVKKAIGRSRQNYAEENMRDGPPRMGATTVYKPPVEFPDLPTLKDTAGHLPELGSDVSIDLENDPIYQAQKAEMLRTLNRRSAAGGKMYSSDADNAVTRNVLPYMQDAYGRNLGDLTRSNQNALATYGLGVDQLERSNKNALTTYGLGYGGAQDLYRRRSGNIMDRYNMSQQIAGTDYSRNLDLAKIGAGAAGAAGQNAMQLGQSLGATYTDAGNATAQSALATGKANAQMWNTLGNAPMNAMAIYNMYKQPQTQYTGYTGAPTSYNTTYSPR